MKKFWKDNSETILVILSLSLCLAGLFFAQSHRHGKSKQEADSTIIEINKINDQTIPAILN